MKPIVVLVIRRRDAFSLALTNAGCKVNNLELIKTEPLEDTTELDDRLKRLNDFDGLFFTSPVAAQIFLTSLGSVVEFAGEIYVLGDRARKVFENAGIAVRHIANANTASDMIAAFGDKEFAGKRLLFVRGDKSVGTIPELLADKATCDELIVYRSIENLPDAAAADAIQMQLDSGEIDWLCFFSPSGVEAFRKAFKAGDTVKTAVIGETTAAAASLAGLNVELVSRLANSELFAAQLIEHIKQN